MELAAMLHVEKAQSWECMWILNFIGSMALNNNCTTWKLSFCHLQWNDLIYLSFCDEHLMPYTCREGISLWLSARVL